MEPQDLDEWSSLKVGALAALAAAGLAACGGGSEESASAEGTGPTVRPASLPQTVAVPAKEQALVLPTATDQPVYRFAKISNGAYFFTGNRSEKDLILTSYPDFRYEGVAFNLTTAPTGIPVYRFANLNNGGYFYTANPAERDIVLQTRPDLRYEGSTFSVVPSTQNGAVPVYRLANLNNGAYLYTASALERDAAVALGFWRYEGISFYTTVSNGISGLPETDAEAARFLLQAQFSASDAEIASVRAQGYAAWLNQQFDAPQGITGVNWLNSRGYNIIDKDTRYYDRQEFADYMIWNQLMTAPDAVRKRCALALSEFFVVSIQGVDSVEQWLVNYGIARFWDILVANAFGNYRSLLEQVTLNSAMGVYLNTKGNLKEDATGRQPDENYAREVMQLFSIGLYQLNLDGTEKRDAGGNKIETYTQSDVSNLARVFTGYNLDQRQNIRTPVPEDQNRTISNQTPALLPMQFFPDRHSNLAATFLGTTIPGNTDGTVALKTALDTLFNHANVGPFIGKQMIQRLVTSNPSTAYVARVASAFNNNGNGVRGDLKTMFAAILLDDEARSPYTLTQNGFGKLREPILRLLQWGRTFASLSIRDSWKIDNQSDPAVFMGQSPFRAPSVFNYFRPGYVPPSTALAATQAAAPEFQIVNETSVSGYINRMQTFISNGYFNRVTDANFTTGIYVDGPHIYIPADYVNELTLVTDSTALIKRLNLLLCAGRLSADTQTLMISALNANSVTAASSDATKLNRVYAAVLMVMASPEYLVQK